jgi:tetratricopeptide (TPR) repeat protein
MHSKGKVLEFRRRPAGPSQSVVDAPALAQSYLALAADERSEELKSTSLLNPDVLLCLCNLLKKNCDTDPAFTLDESSDAYTWLASADRLVGFFDEREYFLGELALICGGAARLAGRRDEVDIWLDRAEAGFRHTVNPGPLIANVAYARLTLYYDRRQYAHVFELLPALVESFSKFGMAREVLKCRFLEAMSLKESSKFDAALEGFSLLASDPSSLGEPDLRALFLVNLGEQQFACGDRAAAINSYRQALSIQSDSPRPLVTAHLKAVLGDWLRQESRLTDAAESYRAAVDEYLSAGMQSLAAYLRLILSETLIATGRHREAEWQIMAALSVIDSQAMLPEAIAAVELLRESVRRRATDEAALRTVSNFLSSKR